MPPLPFNLPFDNVRHFGAPFPSEPPVRGVMRGTYAAAVAQWFRDRYPGAGVFPTASCTQALELAALLLDLQPGDEVLLPSYTFISTANAFALRGARPVFCDSAADSPNIDLKDLERKITSRTRALIAVHYGGSCVDMERLRALADRAGIALIEDAAHAIDARYGDRPLGSFGDFAAFSFHETKNVSCGQGGALLINNPDYRERARTLSDCGANRQAFQEGRVERYEWVDLGSVFNLSELNCAYLYPQLQHVQAITEKRRALWAAYFQGLEPLAARGLLQMPAIDPRCRHNAHVFWLTLPSKTERERLRAHLGEQGIHAAPHYGALHRSPWARQHYGTSHLPQAERYADGLLRLPLYFDLRMDDVERVVEQVTRALSG